MNAKTTRPATAITTHGRRIIATMLAVMASLMVLGTATPAHAAGSAAPDIRVCTTNTWQNKPIYLNQWDGSRYVTVRSGSTNSSSCATFIDVTGNRYYQIQAYLPYNVGSQVWAMNGWTNFSIGNANTTYLAPSFTVQNIRYA